MKNKNSTLPMLRVMSTFAFVLLFHLGMAQGTLTKVTTPGTSVVSSDGKATPVASKSETTPVTFADGTTAVLTAEQMKAYSSRPAIAPAVNGKPDFQAQPIDTWINSFKQWMKENPNFKQALSGPEMRFVSENNFGGLYLYIQHQQQNNRSRSELQNQNGR